MIQTVIGKIVRFVQIVAYLSKGQWTRNFDALDVALNVNGTYLYVNLDDKDYPLFMMFSVPGHCCDCGDC